MEIIEQAECFEEVDRQYKCSSTLVVYGFGEHIFYAHSNSRYRSPAEVRIEELIYAIKIPPSAFCPIFASTFTATPDPLLKDSYIKRPSLISYDRIYKSTTP